MASRPRRESHGRSIAKAISWRATAGVDTFVITFLITGSAHFAGSIAATELVTKIGLYYLHERAWSFIPWGGSRAEKRQHADTAPPAPPPP